MAAKLILTDGGTKKAFKLKGGSARIGSGTGCPIQVRDGDASDEHCLLEKTDAGWELRDLRSDKGTRVNGSLIDQKVLTPGDVIAIGGAMITFDLEDEVEEVVLGQAPAPAPAPAPAAAIVAPASYRSAAGTAGKRSGGRGKARVAAARREREREYDDDDERPARTHRKQGLSTPAMAGIVISVVSILGLLLFLALKSLESDPEANLFNAVLQARETGDIEKVKAAGDAFIAEFPKSPSRYKIEDMVNEFVAARDPGQSQAILYRFSRWFNNLKDQFDSGAYQKDYPDAVQLVIIQADYFLQDAPKNHENFNAVKVMLDRAREKWSEIEARYQFTPKDRKELGTVDYLMRRTYYRACFPMLQRFIDAGDEEDKRDGKTLVADYTKYQKEDFDKNMTIANNRIEKGEYVQALVKLRFMEALFTEEYVSQVRPLIAKAEGLRAAAANGE